MKPVKVGDLARGLSDSDLASCIRDARLWHKTGVMPDAAVALRDFALRLQTESGIDEMSSLRIAEDALWREAASRFLDMHSASAAQASGAPALPQPTQSEPTPGAG